MITDLPVVDFTTCKIVFPYGTINETQLKEMLESYTDDFTVGNFYAERQVGCNKVTFAVVDLPRSVIPTLMKDNRVKDVDLMASYSRAYKSGGACCSPGGG